MFDLVYIPCTHTIKAFILFYFIWGLGFLNLLAVFPGEEAHLVSLTLNLIYLNTNNNRMLLHMQLQIQSSNYHV
jgi:hypothetical protein